MDRRYAVVVAALLAALAPAPAPNLQTPATTAQAAHGLAIAPVPGGVQRGFEPPATRYGPGHRGVDLSAEPGEPIVAAMGGTVTFSGTVAGVGWITVAHGGELDTTYGPIDPRLVTAGATVATGDLLGLLASDATHLNWGARFSGEYLDPLTLLGRWETYLTTEDADDLPVLGGLVGVGGVGTASSRGVHAGGRVWPAPGPLTSGFGHRTHPVTGQPRLHPGIDIGAPAGTPVVAAAAGTVAFAGIAGGYGNTVIVDHGGGVQSLYAHLSVLGTANGQHVGAGARIGAVGSTGLSTGPHLHFEVREAGAPTDPRGWLPSR